MVNMWAKVVTLHHTYAVYYTVTNCKYEHNAIYTIILIRITKTHSHLHFVLVCISLSLSLSHAIHMYIVLLNMNRNTIIAIVIHPVSTERARHGNEWIAWLVYPSREKSFHFFHVKLTISGIIESSVLPFVLTHWARSFSIYVRSVLHTILMQAIPSWMSCHLSMRDGSHVICFHTWC